MRRSTPISSELRDSALRKGSSLKIINPAETEEAERQCVPDSEISGIAKNVRTLLYNGLERRVFYGYTSQTSDESYFHDVSCALHLSLRGLKYLDKLCP